GSGFIPNARRDNFNDSKTYTFLESKLKKLFASLGNLTTTSSKLHNRKKDILAYKDTAAKFEIQNRSGEYTERELELHRETLKILKVQALSSAKLIKEIEDKTICDRKLQPIYNSIIHDLDVAIDDKKIDFDISKHPYSMPLSQLDSEKKKLLEEIFVIIKENLPLEEAETLIKKIADCYN
nr:hypothetical protein [Kiritimatiellia bacterium]